MFADDLKRIAMSAELARTLSRAAEYAQGQSHDQIQLEHLLLALSEDQDAVVVLTASHVDANLLKADVSQYLGGLTDRIVDGAAWPTVAPDLKRILEAAAAAAQHGRRRDINGAIVLAAIIGDGRSPAAHMLRAQGLTFDEAIKALQRALAQPSQIAASAPVPAAGTEDILAAARERVRRTRGIEPHPVAHASPAPAPAAVEPEAYSQPALPQPLPDPAPPHQPVSAGSWADDGRPPSAGEPGGQALPEYYPEHAAGAPLHEAMPVSSGPASPGYEEMGYESVAETTAWMEPTPQQPQGAPGYSGAEFAGEEPSYTPDARSHEAHAYDARYGAQAGPPPAPVQPQRTRPRAALPEPGSRWPKPVAPAWRDAVPAQPPAAAGPHSPPPLPFSGPSLEPQFSEPYARDYPAPGEPAGWDAPQGNPANYGPQGVHPQPLQDEPPTAEFYPTPQHVEPAFSAEQGGVTPGFGEPDAGAVASGSVASIDGPPSRPRRGRKQTEAAARALGEGLPRRLRIHVPVTVEARLAKSDIIALASALSGTPGRSPQPGLAMSVRLRAPDGGIMIDASSSETHWFETRPDVIQSESAHWQWTATAVEPGRPRLQLIAAVRATGADGVTGDHMLPDTLVEVRVRRGFGRVFAGLFKWAFVAALGAGATLYGPTIGTPLWAAVQKLIK